MLKFEQGVDLKNKHTLALKAKSAQFVKVTSIDEVLQAIASIRLHDYHFCVLGEGSNLVFPAYFDGLVIANQLKGIELIAESSTHFMVKAASGENWDGFLDYCMRSHWHGLDNLALIPGTVGASPVQNIGAYGQEVADCIEYVEGIDIPAGTKRRLTKQECAFDYRDSIFKKALKQRFFITAVVFSFSKQAQPNLSYQPLAQKLHTDEADFQAVRAAVISIRTEKLPNPTIYPNAGSFFKNPIIDSKQAQRLRSLFPLIPCYESQQGIKVSAAWLIEQCGLKGFTRGNLSVSAQHALVVVNNGDADQNELMQFAQKIINVVETKFAIQFQQEPINIQPIKSQETIEPY